MAAATAQWDSTRSAAGKLNPWLIIAIISLPTFMEVLDTSIANVSLQNIAGGLSISSDQATWVLTSYLVANAVIIPLSGWLSDAIGRKRYFMISIGLFTAASFLCGISPNLQMLVVARILQGIGGGGLAPVEQSIIADTFPPETRGMAFAAFAIVVVVGPVVGPSLGGYITDNASWHWIFLINVPIGIASLFLVALFVDEPEQVKEDRRKLLKKGLRIDYIGVILIVLGLGLLEYVADRGERLDWFDSPTILAAAAVSFIALVALIFWELHTDNPVIDLRLMKNRNFSMTLLVMMITGLILFGTTQLIPQMLQQVLGYTATDAGLALTVGGIATLFMVPIAGRLTGKVDVRILIGGALLVQAFALWHFAGFTADISFMDAALARMIQSAALPFLFVPINAVAYIGLAQRSTAQASSLLNVARNLGGTFGISISQTTLAHHLQTRQSELTYALNPLDPRYRDWMATAQGALGGGGGDAQLTAQAVLLQQAQQQAAMLAFIDVFYTLLVIVLCVTPLVLLLRSAKNASPPSGAGH